jgi:large subunit ribosomal protein L7/L12
VANKKVEELVEEISKLTVLDLSELVTALQDKLGVSAMPVAAAAAPVAAAAAGDAPAAEEGGNQTVIMTNSGATKIAVIKALREINQALGLKEAKDATDNVPFEVLKDAKPEDVKSAVEKLKAAGATVELK